MRHTQVQDICSAILLGIPCCSCPGRPAVLRPASRHPYPLRTEMDRRAACHHGQAMAHGAWSLALASMAAARITVPTYLSALAACLSSRPPSLALPSCRHRSISRIKCPPPLPSLPPPGTLYLMPSAFQVAVVVVVKVVSAYREARLCTTLPHNIHPSIHPPTRSGRNADNEHHPTDAASAS